MPRAQLSLRPEIVRNVSNTITIAIFFFMKIFKIYRYDPSNCRDYRLHSPQHVVRILLSAATTVYMACGEDPFIWRDCGTCQMASLFLPLPRMAITTICSSSSLLVAAFTQHLASHPPSAPLLKLLRLYQVHSLQLSPTY